MIRIARNSDREGLTFTFDTDISTYSKIEMNVTFGDPPVSKAQYQWPTASGYRVLDVTNVASGEIGYDLYKEDTQYFPLNGEPKLDFRLTSPSGDFVEATGLPIDTDDLVKIVESSF